MPWLALTLKRNPPGMWNCMYLIGHVKLQQKLMKSDDPVLICRSSCVGAPAAPPHWLQSVEREHYVFSCRAQVSLNTGVWFLAYLASWNQYLCWVSLATFNKLINDQLWCQMDAQDPWVKNRVALKFKHADRTGVVEKHQRRKVIGESCSKCLDLFSSKKKRRRHQTHISAVVLQSAEGSSACHNTLQFMSRLCLSGQPVV